MTATSTPIDLVLAKLPNAKPAGKNQWQAKCPGHEDGHASLSITIGDDGRVLLYCHARCETAAIVSALGLKMADLFPPKNGQQHHQQQRRIVATYDYKDETGELLYQSVRYLPKDFRQRRPDANGGWDWHLNGTRRVLYRLPEIIDADPDEIVIVPEGEKDVDNLRKLGFVATCNVGGAGKWKPEYSEHLRGRRTCVIADKDGAEKNFAGQKHARNVCNSLLGKATSVKYLELPGEHVKDATDWLNAGGTADELRRLIDATPEWVPDDAPDDADGVQHKSDKSVKAEAIDTEGIGPDPTELALARALCEQHGRDLRFDVDRKSFRVFNGQCWAEDNTGQANRWAKRVARHTPTLFLMEDQREIANAKRRMESAAGIAAILTLAKTEPGMVVTADDLDQNDYLLNVANGTINLRTGALGPFDRSDLLTKQISTAFDATAKAPLWEKFLNRIMAGDTQLIGYLQRVAGLCLTGDISVQELWIFHGSGANGKSVFVETIMEMLGEYASTAPDSLLIARTHAEHPTEIANLLGLRVVVASETEDGGKLRLQLVKKLTGDSVLKGRFMRCDFFQFRRTHKTILVTNNKPRVSESTEAAWRRIRLIPFDVVIPPEERDEKLLVKLRNEWPGILAWAVQGCLDWQRNGMRPPDKVLAATDDYRNEADPLGDYINDNLTIAAAVRVGRADVWNDYQSWAVKIGEKDHLDRSQLYERIRRLEGVEDGVWKSAGTHTRGFVGVGLRWQNGGHNAE
jgi:putative DNA primase/helicase